MNLYSRLSDFIHSLEKYPATDNPAGQVADIFNALLAATKEAYPDDPVVAAITPAGKGAQSGKSAMNAGSLIAAAEQLRGAAESERGPMVA